MNERVEEFRLLAAEVEDFVSLLKTVHLHLEAVHDGDQLLKLDVDELFGLEARFQARLFGELDVLIAEDAEEFLRAAGQGAARLERQNVRPYDIVYSE